MRRDCNIILSHKIKLSYIMNKFTYILFVFLCLISCAQSNNKKQVLKDRGCDITKKNVTEKTTFYDFFKKFASDSCFQRNHILFPLKITYEGYDYEETDSILHISKSDWIYTNFNDSIIEGQKIMLKVDTMTHTVLLKGYDSGIYMKYLFKKDKSSWILFQIDDYSN